MNISRRGFLKGTSAGLALSMVSLRGSHAAGPVGLTGGDPAALGTHGAVPTYQGFEDLYRKKWRWDRVVKGTHFVNCWYQRGCNWNVFVKDGIVFREEQAGTYEQTRADVPDFNPRGCQKGACYSERMYDASRVVHPLQRAGKRGDGKWKRVSWDQALDRIADAVIDALRTDGPGSIVQDQGTAQTSGCAGLGAMRVSHVLDTPVLDVNCEIGDHHPGVAVTCGKIAFASSADDLFYSDLILIWGGNPTYTQIPNAHFINEARYHGARVITIAPDYNASSIHADEWIGVEIASDAALGLSLAHVMIEEGIYDKRFVKEQTDFPLLVRDDTRRLLRESDLERGGADDLFYLFDKRTQHVREASRKTLSIDGLDPALEGTFRVQTPEGEVAVRPVFARLRQRLA